MDHETRNPGDRDQRDARPGQAASAELSDRERPPEIELLLDGERPEVPEAVHAGHHEVGPVRDVQPEADRDLEGHRGVGQEARQDREAREEDEVVEREIRTIRRM